MTTKAEGLTRKERESAVNEQENEILAEFLSGLSLNDLCSSYCAKQSVSRCLNWKQISHFESILSLLLSKTPNDSLTERMHGCFSVNLPTLASCCAASYVRTTPTNSPSSIYFLFYFILFHVPFLSIEEKKSG